LLPNSFKVSVPFFENVFIPAVQFVHRGNLADGTVESDYVVLFNALYHKSSGIVKSRLVRNVYLVHLRDVLSANRVLQRCLIAESGVEII
jgi:hypothetical protein